MPCLTVFFAKASHYFTLLQHYMYLYINVYILTTASYCLSHFICHTFMYTHTYIYTQRRRVNTLGSTNNTNMHTNICMFFGFCRHLCYRFFVSVRNVFLTLTPWQFHSHICRQFSTRLFATRWRWPRSAPFLFALPCLFTVVFIVIIAVAVVVVVALLPLAHIWILGY